MSSSSDLTIQNQHSDSEAMNDKLPLGGTLDAGSDSTSDSALTTEELAANERKREIARANGKLGGRPRKPVPEPIAPVAPPTTSSEVDTLIAIELVKPEPRFKAIRAFESLRDSLKQAEAQARKDCECAEHEQRRVAADAREEQERAQRKAAYKARMDKKNGITTPTVVAEATAEAQQ